MNNPQDEFMDKLCNLIKDELGLEVSLEELPADGGLYVESGASVLESSYMNKSGLWKVPLLFISKRKSQKDGLQELQRISMHLHYRKIYPEGESFGWADASIVTPANKVKREEDGQYVHSCIVNCLICF